MAKLPKNKLIGLFLIIFFAAILLVSFFVKIPLEATSIIGLFLIIAASLMFGIKGFLCAIFYSTAAVIFANYVIYGAFNTKVSIIIIVNYFLPGISLTIIKEFFKKKEKTLSTDLEKIKNMNIQVETILDSFPYEAWLKDKEGHFLAVNELLAKAVSKSKNEMIGKTDLDIYPEEHAKRFRKDDFEIMKQKKSRFFEELSYTDNLLKLHETYKAPVINEAGEAIGTTGYTRDISEIQKSLFESKKQISLFDSIIDNIPIMLFLKDAKELKFKMINKAAEELLGLSRKEILGKTDYDIFPKNQADFFIKKDREVLNNKSNLSIEEEKISSKDKKMKIVMLDFDKFKVINDKYGHDTGDKLLKSFAGRLKKIVRKIDTIARFGGDEFVMVLRYFSYTEDMEKFAKKVLDVFKEPFKIAKLKLNMNGSMGISVFPDDSLNQSDLILAKSKIIT